MADTQGNMSQHKLTSFYYDHTSESFTTKTTTKTLDYSDILIETSVSGVCFTDVHAKSSGCCLGHEGIGTVVAVGPAVSNLKIGDRVGWGWLLSSCGHCSTCVSGYRQYCADARGFAFTDLDQGAFGDYRIVNQDFAYRIPDKIDSKHAAPLMCAGASVFEALDAAGTKAGDRIGVVGIGGLGHLAILFAIAMGCSVTAISGGTGKLSDAFQLGADEFRVSNHIAQLYTNKSDSTPHDSPNPMTINTLLVTSNAIGDLERFLPLLARRATIVLMTIQQKSLSVPYMSFVLPGHRLIASTEASQENHFKMLEFAAQHDIRPWIQEFPMNHSGIADAFRTLESGEMRYRGVLVREKV